MKRFLFLFLLFLPSPALAFPASATVDVREVDDDMTAWVHVLSGAPTIVITSQACDEELNSTNCSDPFTEGTVTTTKKLPFKGPMTKLTATVTGGTGHAEVFFCGRISP